MPRITHVHSGWGPTAVRLGLGVVLIVGAYQKFAEGLGVTTGYYERVGIPLAAIAGAALAGLELVGGAMLVLGIASRWIGAAVALKVLASMLLVRLPAYSWPSRLEILVLVSAILLVLAGSGRASVDERWLERPA